MQTKLKRPTKIEEVREYDMKVAHSLFGLLKERIAVSFDGITEEELFDPNHKFTMKNSDTPVSKDELKRSKEMIKMGTIPGAILNLPPIIFTSSSDAQSAVPYLNVRAVSWLNTDKPKMLYHSLLSLVKKT